MSDALHDCHDERCYTRSALEAVVSKRCRLSELYHWALHHWALDHWALDHWALDHWALWTESGGCTHRMTHCMSAMTSATTLDLLWKQWWASAVG
jgi:hypothetical protein